MGRGVSAGDERRARWARVRESAKPRAPQAAPAAPAADDAPAVKPTCDGCRKPEPLVAARDGKILCAACVKEKPHEPAIGDADPELREVQRNVPIGGPFALGCIVAAQQGLALVMHEDLDDDADPDTPPPTFMAHVVGSYTWPDKTVTFFFREVPKAPPKPAP